MLSPGPGRIGEATYGSGQGRVMMSLSEIECTGLSSREDVKNKLILDIP
jgi:hypothetical protein